MERGRGGHGAVTGCRHGPGGDSQAPACSGSIAHDHRAGRQARRHALTAAFVLLCVAAGAAVVLALVSSVDLAPRGLLEARSRQPSQHTQELWFSPGIQDQLNRQVRIGQRMSPHLRHQIRRGINAQVCLVLPAFFCANTRCDGQTMQSFHPPDDVLRLF